MNSARGSCRSRSRAVPVLGTGDAETSLRWPLWPICPAICNRKRPARGTICAGWAI